jgi:hypothetical protein
MGFWSRLLGVEKKKNSELFNDQELADAGVCPNCWGKQEWDGKYKEMLEDQTKSNIENNKQGKKAFIQQFVETNITGIKLKKDGDHQVCPKCKAGFKTVSSKAT